MSFGLRYEGSPVVVPQLQLNLLHKSKDLGALADIQNTAGNVAYVSPGVTVRVISPLRISSRARFQQSSFEQRQRDEPRGEQGER